MSPEPWMGEGMVAGAGHGEEERPSLMDEVEPQGEGASASTPAVSGCIDAGAVVRKKRRRWNRRGYGSAGAAPR